MPKPLNTINAKIIIQETKKLIVSLVTNDKGNIDTASERIG